VTANRVQPWLDDGDVQLYHGDSLDVLRQLPAGIAQTCVTSPPYWGLRDYGTGQWVGGDEACDHKQRANHDHAGDIGERNAAGNAFRNSSRYVNQGDMTSPTCRCGAQRVDSQLGLEATPAEYVQNMVNLFREVRRVLRDDGTLWLNLGDSYGSGTSADRNPTSTTGPEVPASWSNRSQAPRNGLKPKDLVGVPWRVAFALQADGWYLRSDIIWSKPNPMPESVSDRPTKAHEYVFLFSKQPRYFYDADAIREPNDAPRTVGRLIANIPSDQSVDGYPDLQRRFPNPAGRTRRSVWTIPTEPFPEAHFATYPQELIRPCILAGTSERGECVECGSPWIRQGEREFVKTRGDAHPTDRYDRHDAGSNYPHSLGGYGRYDVTTIGWDPSCSCGRGAGDSGALTSSDGIYEPSSRPQIVLDPFVGSGTTALVARKHGRRCIGIDLSAEYLAIAAKRTQQLSLLGGIA